MWAQGQEAGGIVASEVLGLVLSPPPHLQGPKQGTDEGGPGVSLPPQRKNGPGLGSPLLSGSATLSCCWT